MELEVVSVLEVRVRARDIDRLVVGVRGESYEYGWGRSGLISHHQIMLRNTYTEQYVNNIRKWKRIESQKVRERVRVKIWAVVTDNLGLGFQR